MPPKKKGGDYVELLTLVSTGTPLLVLGMLLFLERIHTKISVIQDDVREIKEGITWKDTCEQKHCDIERRIERLEHALNGKTVP
ncbi:hypothetical protein LLG96_02030 [bacterium]|nr:hypothetical protein [bacterium]